YFHSGKIKPIAESNNIVGHKTKVFSDDGKLSQFQQYRVEQLLLWTVNPSPMNRRLFVCRNFPIRCEAAEMIDSDDVNKCKRALDALNPPGKSVPLHHIPPIQWISPALARCAKIIGRDSCDND